MRRTLLFAPFILLATPALAEEVQEVTASTESGVVITPSSTSPEPNPEPQPITLTEFNERYSSTITVSDDSDEEEDRLTGEADTSFATGRLFPEQQEVVNHGLTSETNLSACYDNFCGGLYHANTGQRSQEETDLWVSYTQEVGPVEVTGTLAFYELPGEDALNARVSLAVPVTEHFSIGPAVEIARFGYNDEVIALEFSLEDVPLGNRLSVSGTGSLAYSSYAGGISIGGEVGINYALTDKLTLRAFAHGFIGTERSDIVFGLRIKTPL